MEKRWRDRGRMSDLLINAKINEMITGRDLCLLVGIIGLQSPERVYHQAGLKNVLQPRTNKGPNKDMNQEERRDHIAHLHMQDRLQDPLNEWLTRRLYNRLRR